MMKEKTNGITLIALIITIIIMLILVATSVQLTLNSGLFERAGEAGDKWQEAQEDEQNIKIVIGGVDEASPAPIVAPAPTPLNIPVPNIENISPTDKAL